MQYGLFSFNQYITKNLHKLIHSCRLYRSFSKSPNCAVAVNAFALNPHPASGCPVPRNCKSPQRAFAHLGNLGSRLKNVRSKLGEQRTHQDFFRMTLEKNTIGKKFFQAISLFLLLFLKSKTKMKLIKLLAAYLAWRIR